MEESSARGPVVIFLPGMLCGVWFWRFWWRVGSVDYTHALEVPGLYGPEASLWTLGAEAEVDAYAQQIGMLAQGREVMLVAHSYGAQHALALERRRNLNITKMVLVAPALGRWWMVGAGWRLLKVVVKGHNFRRVFMTVEEEVLLPGLREGAPAEETGLGLRTAWPQIVAVALRLGRGLNVRAEVPVLVIWPRQDGALMRRPVDCEAVEVEGGHFLFLRNKAVWDRIARFLVG